MHWKYTGEVIQDRNHLNVLFVANDSQHQVALLVTAEFTVERNRTSVHCLRKVSVGQATCSHMCVVYTATEDRINVLIVEKCLRQTVKCVFMYVFTLVQSDTHVDTVQTVLCGLYN